MEKLTITIETTEEGKISFSFSDQITLETITQILLTVQLSAMNQTLAAAPSHKDEVQHSIYDMFNIAASNLLTQFAPTLELHPDLTTQAILEAENKILDEHYAQLTDEEKLELKRLKKQMKPGKLVNNNNDNS